MLNYKKLTMHKITKYIDFKLDNEQKQIDKNEKYTLQ